MQLLGLLKLLHVIIHYKLAHDLTSILNLTGIVIACARVTLIPAFLVSTHGTSGSHVHSRRSNILPVHGLIQDGGPWVHEDGYSSNERNALISRHVMTISVSILDVSSGHSSGPWSRTFYSICAKFLMSWTWRASRSVTGLYCNFRR